MFLFCSLWQKRLENPILNGGKMKLSVPISSYTFKAKIIVCNIAHKILYIEMRVSMLYPFTYSLISHARPSTPPHLLHYTVHLNILSTLQLFNKLLFIFFFLFLILYIRLNVSDMALKKTLVLLITKWGSFEICPG